MSPKNSRGNNPFLPGTLHALILKTLSYGPSHGYAVARRIEQSTGDAILIEDGSLYPALYRLEKRGLLESGWGRSELDRRAKIYRLTRKGERALEREVELWESFHVAVSKVLLAES